MLSGIGCDETQPVGPIALSDQAIQLSGYGFQNRQQPLQLGRELHSILDCVAAPEDPD